MTRIETFTDAAFAFALTLLVISLDPPTTMQSLADTLVHVPGFLLGATLLMVFWNAHHRWSRRFGLDDSNTILLSCLLVFTVLLFVYPLRYMTSALSGFIATLTGLPVGPELDTLGLTGREDVNRMFVVYGVGFMAMSASIVLLNVHAWRRRALLGLSHAERVETKVEIVTWCVLFTAGLLSTAVAAAMPHAMPVAGWVYAPLGVVIPLFAWFTRWRNREPSPPPDAT
ncbi:hypothetical protein N788_00355 [Arenimonas donghaensis DSM 18148 = HO3-R19]|uniref:Transglutaminase n=2 Tax=Arenimonas TaxID=490567 RepID=A0A087MLA0_9GAMM|nr:hypothetical protein N788_00355 [Arenimonas donghaensis DSM 18148 = HO3-R19]